MMLINGVSKKHIDIADRGFQYGDGLFETIEVRNGQAVFLARHLERLNLGCIQLNIPVPDAQLLRLEANELCRSVAANRAVLKIIITRGSGGRGYRPPDVIQPTRVLGLYPYPDYPELYPKQGIVARFCTTRLGLNPSLAGIKHLNRLEQVMARSEWNDPAIQEGLMLDVNGHIIEGTVTNLFYIKNHSLYTAKLDQSGVAGIMRRIIMTLSAEHGLAVVEHEFTQDELLSADEVFVCNSIIGIWPIKQIATIRFSVGPITQSIQILLDRFINADCMDAGGSTPRLGELEQCGEQFPRATADVCMVTTASGGLAAFPPSMEVRSGVATSSIDQQQQHKERKPKHATINIKIICLVLLMLGFASGWMWMDYQTALHQTAVNEVVYIEIEKGDSLNRIIDKLVAQKLAVKPFWFKVIALQGNAFRKLKTGEYELTSGLTAPQILALFVQGKTKQHAITFPEGWSFKEILHEIEKNPNLEHSLNGVGFESVMSKLKVDQQSPEGLFFPDTYFFEKHTSDLSVLKRAYDKMQRVLQQEWLNKAENLPFKTPYEALILASIVEKETGVAAERHLIAGVFIRRLEQNMLLQTDPTVIYGMGEAYQGDIKSKDLLTATPYNTYVVSGLPPTPIAMPGRDSLNAALHPDNGENLYFVARGDGTHVFSATLNDHNVAVDEFQRKMK